MNTALENSNGKEKTHGGFDFETALGKVLYNNDQYFKKPSLIRKFVLKSLKKVLKEKQVDDILSRMADKSGLEAIQFLLDDLEVRIEAHNFEDIIPPEGPLFVVANHPLGIVDSLALLSTVGKNRSDVQIIVNEFLDSIKGLRPVFLPIDVFGEGASKRDLVAILSAVEKEKRPIIIFPSGRVAQYKNGVLDDGEWKKGIVSLAKKKKVPILPVFVDAQNSHLFYTAQKLSSLSGTGLLMGEVFKQKGQDVRLFAGDIIDPSDLENDDMGAIQNLKQTVYELPGKLTRESK